MPSSQERLPLLPRISRQIRTCFSWRHASWPQCIETWLLGRSIWLPELVRSPPIPSAESAGEMSALGRKRTFGPRRRCIAVGWRRALNRICLPPESGALFEMLQCNMRSTLQACRRRTCLSSSRLTSLIPARIMVRSNSSKTRPPARTIAARFEVVSRILVRLDFAENAGAIGRWPAAAGQYENASDGRRVKCSRYGCT